MMKSLPPFSRNVILLSLVSFLNDLGGETIKKIIPLYLSNVLGVAPTIIGLIEGVAEALPQMLQPISGNISDRIGKRKPLMIAGQLLRSCVLLLVFASSWIHILIIRAFDRSGKGIANAPRDALVTDSSEVKHVGRSFGLTRMFDNMGAVVGLLLASYIIASYDGGMVSQELLQRIIFFAAIPSVVALCIVFALIREVRKKAQKRRVKFALKDGLGKKFYIFLGCSVLFALGNSSDAFLILKAQSIGVSVSQIFLFLALYSFVSSVLGLPLSTLSDRLGRKTLIVTGWVLYSVLYAIFSQTHESSIVVFLFVLYGLYGALTEGVAKAWVSDIVPENKRATAFGMYNMAVGVTLLPASLLAGFLWQTFDLSVALGLGSVVSFVAAVGVMVLL